MNNLLKEKETQLQKELQDAIFTAKQKHQSYMDSIKKVFPKYFESQLKIKTIQLTEIKDYLKNNEVVVSYIWNTFNGKKELLFGLITTKKETITFSIENLEVLKEVLKNYKKLISKPFKTKDQQQEFQKVSFNLYKVSYCSVEQHSLLFLGKYALYKL